MIRAMEDRLGVKLLMRTTRKVTATEAGTALLDRARTVLAELEDAEIAARGANGLSGVLHVSTPVTFGAREIAWRLGPLLDTHPALRVELLMTDRRVDLLDEGVDLAIRLGALDDPSFVSRRVASAPRYIVASPAYVESRGTPRVPVDLQTHNIITGRAPSAQVWTLRHASNGETSVKLTVRIVATSTEGVLAARLAGLDVAASSDFACLAELASGELVRLLTDHSLPSIDAIMPAGCQPPAKAQAAIAYLADAVGGAAYMP